ncbi:hypothetical protein F4604DRAFT_1778367 [Suillus subluteus]|nr:hypothetical protein F4604DRAFT_1778367 [Suillus subluteus]
MPNLFSNKPAGNNLEDNYHSTGFLRRTDLLLSCRGTETRSIAPVPTEERLETQLYQMFFVWLSYNMNTLVLYSALILRDLHFLCWEFVTP